MKNLLSALLVLGLTLPAFAGVKEDVAALGDLAFGWEGIQSKGKTASEVLKNWLINEYSEEEIRLVHKEIDEMEYSDEVDWGFTSTRSAMRMGGFAESALEEKLEYLEHAENPSELRAVKAQLAKLKKNWNSIIQRLDRQGVKFGYDGNGPGYCGISFVKLLVIDPKTQKVYEVYLSESGEC